MVPILALVKFSLSHTSFEHGVGGVANRNWGEIIYIYWYLEWLYRKLMVECKFVEKKIYFSLGAISNSRVFMENGLKNLPDTLKLKTFVVSNHPEILKVQIFLSGIR